MRMEWSEVKTTGMTGRLHPAGEVVPNQTRAPQSLQNGRGRTRQARERLRGFGKGESG